MKELKFAPDLVTLIKNGTKTCTWRLFDDKNLREGDLLTFIARPELIPFAKARITNLKLKSLKDIDSEDRDGHEEVGNLEDMCKMYKNYYKEDVNPDTKVKVIKYKILEFI